MLNKNKNENKNKKIKQIKNKYTLILFFFTTHNKE
jgi:hypothetical protein